MESVPGWLSLECFEPALVMRAMIVSIGKYFADDKKAFWEISTAETVFPKRTERFTILWRGQLSWEKGNILTAYQDYLGSKTDLLIVVLLYYYYNSGISVSKDQWPYPKGKGSSQSCRGKETNKV